MGARTVIRSGRRSEVVERLMWIPTTRLEHSREHLRYGSDPTDAEWKILAPLLSPEDGVMRGTGRCARLPMEFSSPALGWSSVLLPRHKVDGRLMPFAILAEPNGGSMAFLDPSVGHEIEFTCAPPGLGRMLGISARQADRLRRAH